MNGLVAVCLAAAATALAWPGPGRGARLRRALSATTGSAQLSRPLAALTRLAHRCGLAQPGFGPLRALLPAGEPPRSTQPTGAGAADGPGGLMPRDPFVGRRGPALAVVLAVSALAGLAGGPVAAVIAGAYAGLAVRGLARQRRRRAGQAARAEMLELLNTAAADLRAGLPAQTALPVGVWAPHHSDPAGPRRRGDRTGGPAEVTQWWGRLRAAVQLAEQTGAPLADLLDRIEADARGTERAHRLAAAQVAGARATGWLLAALPAGGLALGYMIGADPLPVLLGTPLGAACAIGAVVLQLGGLGWTGRIVRPAGEGA